MIINMRSRFSFRKIHLISKIEYSNMVLDPRNIIFIAMFIVFYDKIIKPFIGMSTKMGKPIHVLEPFAAIANTGLVVIVVPLVFLLFVSDYPRTNANFKFYMVRSGKYNWFIGQLLAVIKFAVTYLFAFFIGTVLIALPHSYIENQWSDVTTKYYLMFPDEAQSQSNQLINGTLYNQTTPYKACLDIFLLYFLLLLIIAMIAMLAFMISKRNFGLCFSASILLIGGVISMVSKEKVSWFFPATHVLLWRHYEEVMKKQIFPIDKSFAILSICAVTLTIVSFVMLKFKKFDEV